MKKIFFRATLFIFSCAICLAADSNSTAANSPVITREFIFDDAPFASCHASTVVETNDGTLVAAWFGGTKEGANDVAIWSSFKEKGDERWSEPKLVGNADDETVPCWNPVLFQPSDGPTMLFYKQGREIAKWQGVLLLSRDGGRTWGERRVLPEFFIGPVKNKPVELADGTILCPSSTEHDGWRVHFESIPALDKTWSRTQAINTKEEGGAIQPSVLFHKDGRLQAICRNRNGLGTLWQTWSDDGGRTWSKLTPTSLPNPCSGTDAVTLRDGRQLLVYNHTTTLTGGRNILNVAISDDGIVWRAVGVLENEKGEFSYPAVVQSRDGTVHITYTWKREKIMHVALDPERIVGGEIVDASTPFVEPVLR